MNKSQRKAKRARAKYHSLGRVKRVMLELGIPSCALLNNDPSFMGQIIPLRQMWQDESSLDGFKEVLAKTLMSGSKPKMQIQLNDRPVEKIHHVDPDDLVRLLSLEFSDAVKDMFNKLITESTGLDRVLLVSTPSGKPSAFEELARSENKHESKFQAFGGRK